MAVDIIQRLTSAEDDILDALSGQGPDLSLFEKSWSILQNDLELAMLRREVNADTVSFAYTVASRIGRIASCFMELEKTNLELKSKLHGDFDNILSSMDNLSLSPNIPQHPSPSPSRHSRSPSSPDSSFISEAYSWLLKNLANPYPSLGLKTSLAQRYGCSITAVSSWFVNVRRRMGWTALCRDHFHNCRADTVDAAHRAFVQEDPKRLLSPEITHAFMVMKVTAEGLYSETFTKSALAGDLDAVLKDITASRTKVEGAKPSELVEFSQEPEEGTRGRPGYTRDIDVEKTLAQHCYPSPVRSHSSSPVPSLEESLTDESEDEKDVSPPIFAGRKRCSSPSELDHAATPISTGRPIKRLRSGTSSFVSGASLPSPSTSADNDFPDRTRCSLPIAQTCTPITASRKRCLSDTDANGIPKRPRDSMAAPHPHTVSDPLPRPHLESEYSIDEWFNTNFDALFALPPPVDAMEPDFSTQWEVELFNNYNIPQDLQRRLSKACTPLIQVHQSPASPDLVELEDLLQSIQSGEYPRSPETSQQSRTCSDARSSFEEFSVASNGPQSIDWTALLNNAETLEPAIDCILPQSCVDSQPLPEIDLTILQLPQVMPTVTPLTTSSADYSSKQAKLHQLQAMQEAVRRMERELQSEGIAV